MHSMRRGHDAAFKAKVALVDGLSQLAAPLPLIRSVINMEAAINSGLDLQAINKGSLPVIRPFIEDFIQNTVKALARKKQRLC